jgi:Tol biopolymer transport system component
VLVALVAGAIAIGSRRAVPPAVVEVPESSAPADTSPSLVPEPQLGVVAYEHAGRIWVVNGDGTGAHELLADEPGEQRPIAWSPDGSKLLYASEAWGDDLALTDATGSPPEILPNESLCGADAPSCRALPGNVSFSPDGARLAYAIFGGPSQRSNGVIAVFDIGTLQVTRLESSRIPGAFKCCDGYYEPSWSADSTRLAFAMPSLTSFTLNVDGSDLRRLMPPGQGGTSPQWSPHGSEIASDIGGVDPAIFLVQPDGGNFRTVARDAYGPQWTRDGRIVFYRDEPDTPGALWIMDAGGGNARPLDGTIPALTAAGCIVCPIRDGEHQGAGSALWQPVPGDQP